VDDQQHGQGVYTYANGMRYEGEWRHNEKWNGKEYGRKGDLVRVYANGQITQATTSGGALKKN